MNILLIGPPGAGKGSQAEKLVSQKAFKHLSTGDLFRKALREKTPLGLKAGSYVDRGALVPDSITIGLVEEALGDFTGNVIFDGFPRTVPQSEALDQFLQKRDQKLDHVISLEVSDDVVLRRLTGRRWAPQSGKIYHVDFNPPKNSGKCDETGEELAIRSDDRPEVVQSRLKNFREITWPLLKHYKIRGILKEVNGEGAPEKIFQSIVSFLK
ncbi:MAG: adenylate kinase [Bdellovibrionales bacterium]|nr:adenylate kinase [Bdellovibrionales bacterium]